MPDLSVANDFARNEGRYQQVVLKYPNSFPIGSALRPDIKIELTFADILLPINDLEVKTLIEDNFDQTKLFIRLALLKSKSLWKERYEDFIEAMVYDSTNALPYDEAISVLEGISANVINKLCPFAIRELRIANCEYTSSGINIAAPVPT